jgi:hypothetical protein
MSMFTDLTPAELADALDRAEQFPHNTGALSMLDEATMAYGRKYPAAAGPQQAFVTARYAHMRSYSTRTGSYSDEAWREATEAAHALAAVLRPLGDARIARCKRRTGWGTCNIPLDADGTCHVTEHIDADAEAAP